MFCESPRLRSLGHICVLRVTSPAHDGFPQSTRRAALRRAEKSYDRLEPWYPRQRTHVLTSGGGGCGSGKYGDE